MTRPEPREPWRRARPGPTLGQHHQDRGVPAFRTGEAAIEPEPTKRTPVRVLVIEDDPDVADGIERILTTIGFQVQVAFDGRDGLNKALADSYGLIIVDLLLPSVNGFKLCAQIREAESWVPIMVLTAKTGDMDQAESLDAGADDFLTKPFALAVFVAHVRALLRRASHIQVRRLTENGLVLDPVRHRCSNSTVEVQLSAREVDVLACLMTNSGRAMSKNELLTRVWGPDFQGDPNIVEVYVGHLRKKLEAPFERRVIDTAAVHPFHSVQDDRVLRVAHFGHPRRRRCSARCLRSQSPDSAGRPDPGDRRSFCAGSARPTQLPPPKRAGRAIGRATRSEREVVGIWRDLARGPPASHGDARRTGSASDHHSDSAIRAPAGPRGPTRAWIGSHSGRSPADRPDHTGYPVSDGWRCDRRTTPRSRPFSLLVWVITGRALRPVETARAAVASISDSDPASRIPSPRTGDEVERLVGTMNAMLERQGEVIERELRFIADASHELRSPIAAARAALESEAVGGDASASRDVALRALRRLHDLADQLLVLDSAGRKTSEAIPVDVDDLIFAYAEQLPPGTTPHINTSAVSGGQVYAKEVDIIRIIENLGSNAVRHAQSQVVVALSEVADRVELTVTDDGPGVPDDRKSLVFERFYRLESDRSRAFGGAGLGLAIVRELTTKYGGSVHVEDVSPCGARFVVQLPTNASAAKV